MTDETKGAIRAIIVDDEMPARENLKFMLADFCPQVIVLGAADGVRNGLKLFNETKPDLVFLDIRMPSGAEGFELLKQLSGHDFYVVFVTAFKDYAIRAFESRALHYILKPIDENDLIETVERVLQRRSTAMKDPDERSIYQENLRRIEVELQKHTLPSRISIHHAKGIKFIDPEEIAHLEGNGNCTILHFADGSQYLDTRTLKVYEALVPEHFYRTHKSHIVNLKMVVEILHGQDQSVVLKGSIAIPISRERKKKLLTEISKFI